MKIDEFVFRNIWLQQLWLNSF